MPLGSVDRALFRRACAQFATGVVVATVVDSAGGPHGLTVNSFTSVSLDPPLVLFCIDLRAAVLPHFQAASHFAINVLASHQRDLSNRFASKPDQRFDGVAWRPGETGAPVLDGCIAHLECLVRQVMEGGDHLIFLGEVVAAESPGGDPLLYFSSRYQSLKA